MHRRTFSPNPSSGLKSKFGAWLAVNRLQVLSMSFRSGQLGGSHSISNRFQVQASIHNALLVPLRRAYLGLGLPTSGAG